jgi:hypothetical protein
MLTVMVVEPWIPLKVAVINALPTVRPVTRPRVPAVLLTVAMPLLPELQLTRVVRSCTLPSLKFPSAAS